MMRWVVSALAAFMLVGNASAPLPPLASSAAIEAAIAAPLIPFARNGKWPRGHILIDGVVPQSDFRMTFARLDANAFVAPGEQQP